MMQLDSVQKCSILSLALALALPVGVLGCAQDDEPEEGDPSSAVEAARASCTGASITASTPVSYGQTTLVKFNPGSCADQSLFTHLQCFQNGVLVAEGYGWEMHYGVSIGAYSWVSDHYELSYGLSSAAWQSGAADCTVQGDYYKPKGNTNFVPFTSFSFHVDP